MVKRIPDTFVSFESYLDSFAGPLIEEVHADIFSSLDGYAQANFTQVIKVEKLDGKKFENPVFSFQIAEPVKDEMSRETYEPSECDIIVLSPQKPKHVSDLTQNKASYVLGLVLKSGEEDDFPPNCCIVQLSSDTPIEVNEDMKTPKGPLFAVYIMNMTTYSMWNCLHLGENDANSLGLRNKKSTELVDKVWQYNPKVVEDGSSSCSQLSQCFAHRSTDGLGLEKFNLNASQLNAVADCVASMDGHSSSIKLLWGPPGTGKTKTISTILWAMLMKGQKTLACAPTNTAVLEVAARIVNLVGKPADGSLCFLNDIILFGNRNNMKMDDDSNIS